MPVLRCELAAGDWLYIPSGYWHQGRAFETGITLAVGVMPHTAIELIDFLRQRLVQSLFWRPRLPVVGAAAAPSGPETEAQFERLVAECGSELAKVIASADLAADFVKHLHSAPASRSRVR